MNLHVSKRMGVMIKAGLVRVRFDHAKELNILKRNNQCPKLIQEIEDEIKEMDRLIDRLT